MVCFARFELLATLPACLPLKLKRLPLCQYALPHLPLLQLLMGSLEQGREHHLDHLLIPCGPQGEAIEFIQESLGEVRGRVMHSLE